MRNISLSNVLIFLLPSLLGLFFFLVPLPFDGSYDLAVGVFAKTILNTLNPVITQILLGVLGLAFILSAVAETLPLTKENNGFLYSFKVGPFWLLTRFLGFVFCFICYSKIGPHFIWSNETGSMILGDLLPFLFCLFICAGFLLPLLLDFGLLEFFGILLTKVMKPLFTLPGRSSLDCMSSVIGDGSIGILLTNKQYEEGLYTRREAMVIVTTFSFVSITFSFVVLAHTKLSFLVFPFFITIGIAAFVAAVICPRIPPLSRIEDTYYKKRPEKDELAFDHSKSLFSVALHKGLAHAKDNASLSKFIKGGFQNVLDMWFGVLPAVMCFGTISLIIAQHTPIFKYLGLIFYPLLLALRVPEAYEASQALVIGFSDMFLPVIISHGIKSDLTRFIIACTSVSQLIFMSEVGALLLSSKIGIKFSYLVQIFLLRTVITLPVIVLCANFFVDT